MATEEPVTSPDQHKPTFNRKWAGLGLVVSVAALIMMIFWRNHQGRIEDIYLAATAGILVLIPIVDAILRRRGLRSR